jgi:hypothetical protein
MFSPQLVFGRAQSILNWGKLVNLYVYKIATPQLIAAETGAIRKLRRTRTAMPNAFRPSGYRSRFVIPAKTQG